MNEISDNTKAILLLTGPLIVSKKDESAKTLSLKEYNTLARILQNLEKQPKDLLAEDLGFIDSQLPSSIDIERLQSLLARGFQLGQALTAWQQRGIWILSRADVSYPNRLKNKLKEAAPPILYGCGNASLLKQGGLAVVGSRKITEELKQYTINVGALAASANIQIVSGAARGIDSSAMAGSFENGGCVIGVMADSLGRAAVAKANRAVLREGRLVLVSAYDPSAGFNVGHAMQRNKAIYAFADAGLVVTSDLNKGGTWTGAIEQLEKLRLAPVFVREHPDAGKGCPTLLQKGGIPWPEPSSVNDLRSAMANASKSATPTPQQEQMSLYVKEDEESYHPSPKKAEDCSESEHKEGAADTPADRLLSTVKQLLIDLLSDPKSINEVAEVLNVSKAQSATWLKHFVNRGEVVKLSRPVRYQSANKETQLL